LVGWFQIIVPVGTPPEVVQRLNVEVNKITATPEVSGRLADRGVYVRQDNVAASREFFSSQQRAARRLVTELGIQAQ
jgi:tripartite-type tricarboxylate transporter receptor subunit TctC